MVLSIGERIKGFLVSPSKTFDDSKEDTLGDAFKYLVVILLIPAVLFAVIAAALLSLILGIYGAFLPPEVLPLAEMGPALAAVGIFILVLVSGIIGVLIGGLWFHIWVYLVGGRKGVGQTIKAVMYGQTPNCLLGWILGWIPIVGFIPAIWTLIVEIIGIRQLHELSTGRAVLAWILAIIIPAIIAGAIFAVFIATMTGPGFPGPTGI